MPVPVEGWRDIAPPHGTRWTQRAYGDAAARYREPGWINIDAAERATAQKYRACIHRIEAWARQHDIHVTAYSAGTAIAVRGRQVVVPYKFCVSPWLGFGEADHRGTHSVFHHSHNGECPFCGREFTIYHTECPGCHKPLECASCKKGRGAALPKRIRKVWYGGEWKPGCNSCFSSCQHHEFHPDQPPCRNYCRGGAVCHDHGEFFTCEACRQEFEVGYRTERGEHQFCHDCAMRRCWTCGGNDRLEPDERGREYYCRECRRKREELGDEQIDRAADMTPEQLVIPSLPARPVRLMSIEQEFCQPRNVAAYQAANDIAGKLYNSGLAPSPRFTEYHHSGEHGFICAMERDATVNGGELVYQKLKMSDKDVVTKFKQAWDIVRAEHLGGKIIFNLRCGMHIHIDLHGFNYDDCRTLQTIFGYLEDPLFRLSAANYGEHRAIMFSKEYARPIKKGKWADSAEFVSDVLRHSHNHDALSLAHYYKALRNCRCGRVEVGAVDKCKCNLGKCTAEWRIFNGTTNAKKLHAYMALAQSITAWCHGREARADQFPEMSLNSKVDFTKGADTDAKRRVVEDWKPRVEWMFSNLTLTDAEWDSVIYTMKNSHLKYLGNIYIESLKARPKVPDNRRLVAPEGFRGQQPAGRDDLLARAARAMNIPQPVFDEAEEF